MARMFWIVEKMDRSCLFIYFLCGSMSVNTTTTTTTTTAEISDVNVLIELTFQEMSCVVIVVCFFWFGLVFWNLE